MFGLCVLPQGMDMLRKLTLVGMCSLLKRGSVAPATQNFVVLQLACFFLMIQFKYMPYR